MSTKVITGEVRFSYLNWAAPRMNELSGKSEYSSQIWIPKTDKKTIKLIEAAIKAAIEKKWAGKAPANFRNPLRDGDTEQTEKGQDVAPGCMFLNIRTDQKPGVVDKDRNHLIEADDFVSGDYGRVSINAYGYDQKGNKGVGFGFNNAQFLRKGEALGSRVRAEDDFADDDEEL